MRQQAVALNKQSRWFNLSMPNLLTAIVFISIFAMAVRIPFTSDTWWHLRTGQYVIENGAVPLVDPFSHSKAGQLWVNQSWLSGVLWYVIYAAAGWPGLALAVAGLATLSFWLVWKQIEGNLLIAAFVMILGAIVSSVMWMVRPQIISSVLAALLAYLLYRFKRYQGRLLPWVPLMMLVWANLHGGYAIGFMLMLAYLFGETMNHLTAHPDDPVVSWPRLKHLLVVILISLAVVVINPYTWRAWIYPFQTVGIGALRDFIQEWRSPDFHLPLTQPFILMLLLVMVAIARAGRRADWTDLTLVTLWTALSLFAGRNITVFGLLLTPILARYADLAWTRQWQTWGRARPPFSSFKTQPGRPARFISFINWGLLILVISAALAKISVPLLPQTNLQVERESEPYQAVEFIRREHPPGPIFNSYNWGGYLIFKLWPQYPVYIDGRTDLYDDAFIRRYIEVMVANDGWQEILSEAGINLVFIETNSTLVKPLQQDPAWRELYRDNMTVIFGRKTLLP